jgi:hypothetical protein
MRPDENATEADNKGAQASDPEFDDEVYPLDPPQEAETVFRNTSKLTRKLSKIKGNPKAGIPSKHLENAVGSESPKSPLLLVLQCEF